MTRAESEAAEGGEGIKGGRREREADTCYLSSPEGRTKERERKCSFSPIMFSARLSFIFLPSPSCCYEYPTFLSQFYFFLQGCPHSSLFPPHLSITVLIFRKMELSPFPHLIDSKIFKKVSFYGHKTRGKEILLGIWNIVGKEEEALEYLRLVAEILHLPREKKKKKSVARRKRTFGGYEEGRKALAIKKRNFTLKTRMKERGRKRKRSFRRNLIV